MSDAIDPSKLKVAELRAELQARGLDTKGNKPVLVERLKEALQQANEDDSGEEPVEGEPDQDLERDGDEDNDEGEEELDQEDEVLDQENEAEPVLDLEPEQDFEQESEHDNDEPALELEPEGDLDAEEFEQDAEPQQEEEEDGDTAQASPSPQDQEEEKEEKHQRKESSPPQQEEEEEEESRDKDMGNSTNLREEEDEEEEEEEERHRHRHGGDAVTVKEELEDEYYKSGYEEAPMEDDAADMIKKEVDNGFKDEKIDMVEVKEEPVETKQEPSSPDTEERRGEKRRAHSRSRSPDSKKARPEVEEVRVEDEPEFDKSAVLLDWYNSDLSLVISKEDFLSAQPLTMQGFGYVWHGVRATYGFTRGRVFYEVKVLDCLPVPHLEEDEQHPHVVRVGWSIDEAGLTLGEDPFSYGYGGTGKASTNLKFKDYGKPFGKGDVIGCYLDLEAEPITMSFTVNGDNQGTAYEISHNTLGERALFPHILTKNCSFKVNFGVEDPWFTPLTRYTYVGHISQQDRVLGGQGPSTREEAEMVRHYERKTCPHQARPYSHEDLVEAVRRVKEGEPCKTVARMLHIPHRTLRNHVSGERKTSESGRKRALLPEEELSIAHHMATFSDYGYSFDQFELRLFVKSFLDKAGRDCPYFKNNMPGIEWSRSFLDRHSDLLSGRVCQNISRKRAAVSVETVNRFFDNLGNALQDIPPENIINYDETNLCDDPKGKKMIFRKGIKYAERIMNTSKSAVSLMFSCSASGDFLPPYVVYRAERLMDSWVVGGPIGTRYNRTKSGWFDGFCFKDWLKMQVVPYFNHLSNDSPRVLIGDNLASHLSADVIELCEKNNIRMVFLPPNSTHLLQPLDVAIYGPMKAAWRKVLTKWKQSDGMYYTTLPKVHFPRLLLELMHSMEDKSNYAISGFRTTGIYPLNRQKVVSKLTKDNIPQSAHHLVSPMLMEKLAEMRAASCKKPGPARRGRAIKVSPGKSVSFRDIDVGSSGQQTKKTGVKRKLRVSPPESDSDSSSDVDMPGSPLEYDKESSENASEVAESSEMDQEEEGRKEIEEGTEKEGEEEEGTEKEEKESKTEEIKDGTYVVVKFPGKKANSDFHFVGKVLGKEGSDVSVKYFRRDCNISGGEYMYFKEPRNEDICPTEITTIVKCLPIPTFIKDKICFKASEMSNLIIR